MAYRIALKWSLLLILMVLMVACGRRKGDPYDLFDIEDGEVVPGDDTWELADGEEVPNEDTLEEVEVPEIVTECHGQRPELIDLSSGSALITGHTADGVSGTYWNSYACPSSHNSQGRELIYAIYVPKRQLVRILARATDPENSRIVFYVRNVCNDRFKQVACAFAPGDGAPAQILETFDKGVYYVFVDDFAASIDTPQAFELEVELL